MLRQILSKTKDERLPAKGMHSTHRNLVRQQIVPRGHEKGQFTEQPSGGKPPSSLSKSGHLSSISEMLNFVFVKCVNVIDNKGKTDASKR